MGSWLYIVDWGGGMYANCTVDPVVCLYGQ